jgi:hypothetical protein
MTRSRRKALTPADKKIVGRIMEDQFPLRAKLLSRYRRIRQAAR